MSYSGKQSNEVGAENSHFYCAEDFQSILSAGHILLVSDCGSALAPEMAGYHQGSEVPPETAPPQHCGVSWLLPERAHSMGECVCACMHVRACVSLTLRPDLTLQQTQVAVL